MDENKKTRGLEILELPPDASWTDISRSYSALKQLYSTTSMATLPVEDELPEDRRKTILNQIEEAYKELENIYTSSKKNLEKNIKSIVSGIESFSGPSLKMIRERLNIELCDIAMETKIQLSQLKRIENEEYSALPREIYMVGYLKNYARYLALDPKKVVADYMEGYKQWRNENPEP